MTPRRPWGKEQAGPAAGDGDGDGDDGGGSRRTGASTRVEASRGASGAGRDITHSATAAHSRVEHNETRVERIEHHTYNGPTYVGQGFPGPSPSLPTQASRAEGLARRDLFAAGSGVGSKIIMAPLFGSPFDPAHLLTEFIESLLAVGLDEEDVAPFREVVDGFVRATCWDEAVALLTAYNAAMWNVDTLVRGHCTAGRLTWFTLGQLLFQVAYQGTYAHASPGGDSGLSDQRDMLFHFADGVELPATLRSELQRFARMPAATAMDGHLVDEARRLARVVHNLLTT
ncbi:hypothetical protein [Streptomyces nojiriensis]|uniref:hypothetical protein n=1 Tax=Streptomyces nojiriensis TaxID=66374 RepID=UPI001676A510|nr:hypothetical protein [Streptomyces nojiriensis]